MTLTHAHAREWRQFRLLTRDATRRLLNSALLAREGDPFGFAIWMLALVSTPPSFYAVHQLLGYVTLRFASPAVFERTVLGDRLIFVIYAMVSAFLLASLVWEALFPDRAEQEILGVLAVRPRTAAAARLLAALSIGAAFALAVNGPAALIFTVASTGHPALRHSHVLFIGHLASTYLAGLSVFLTLLAIRGALAVAFGARVGRWMAVGLQFTAIIALVELFFFMPALLDVSLRLMRDADGATWFPPVWFASLFSWIGRDARPAFAEASRWAVLAPALLALVVVPLYVLSGSRISRGLLETQDRHRPAKGRRALEAIAGGVRMCAPVRALFLFASSSLGRSRPHLLMLSSYVSLGIALVIFRVVVLGLPRPPSHSAPARLRYDPASVFGGEPTAGLLAVPLIVIFFLVVGLRAAFRVPTDPAASWPLRLRPPRSVDCARATWWTLVVLGLGPVIAVTLLAALVLWPLPSAMATTLVTTASGLLLVEWVLIGWTAVPFACEHAPSSDTVKWKWIAGLAALVGFAFVLSPLEARAVQSASGTAMYLGAALVVWLLLRMRQLRALAQREATFEEASGDSAAVLNLSEALN